MTAPDTKGQYYLEGIAAGDDKIINEIYKNYHKAIRHLVETHGGSGDDARDVFQEGLMLLYQKSKDPAFKLEGKFLTYFYAVCRNIWFNRRKKKSFGEVTLSDEMKLILTADEVIAIEENEQYHLYRVYFKKLGEDCQRVLRMYLDKVSMKEIATKMKYGSENYAKKRKFECKKKLVKLIEKDPRYQELKF